MEDTEGIESCELSTLRSSKSRQYHEGKILDVEEGKSILAKNTPSARYVLHTNLLNIKEIIFLFLQKSESKIGYKRKNYSGYFYKLDPANG